MVPSKGSDGDRHDDDDGDRTKKCNKSRRSTTQELSRSSIPCTNINDSTTTSHNHHRRLLKKAASESIVLSKKSIVVVPCQHFPRVDFVNDAANTTEKEAEEEVLNAEQQQQSQFRKNQIGHRQIVYSMDQLPTVRSGFTVPRLSHHPYTEGRGELFNNATSPEQFNNTATATATTTDNNNNNNNNNNNPETFAAMVAVAPTTINHTTARRGGSERNLIGATISITKGRYKGMTGIVSERLIIRQYQLDTIPTPLLLVQLQIIEYPTTYTPSSSIDHDHDDEQYQYIDTHFETKYIGAKVRVLTSTINDHVGKEGTVINIVSMGDDWYITNNPLIDMALHASKFHIIKYADLPVICIDDDNDDTGVMTDMVGKEKGMMEFSNNNDKQHQQQQQTQEEELKTAVAADIAKAVVRNVMDKEKTFLSHSAGGGGSSLPVIPPTRIAPATITEATIVDLTNQLSSSDPPVSPQKVAMTRKKRRKEIYSVKLPTFESIELASRLSAFDSFLFLVNDQQQQVTDSSTTSMTCRQVSDVATIVTKNRESVGHDQRRAENNVQDKNATIITKKNEETLKTKTRLFIDSLIQQNKDTHHLPTVLITPGMEIVIDKKERQKKRKRIIPLEERTVVSTEERNVLMDRLSVFDDYLFLLSQNS